MNSPTLGTLRDLDIMQLEGEAYALEIYNEFMGELYGKRQRPDQPTNQLGAGALPGPDQQAIQMAPSQQVPGPMGY